MEARHFRNITDNGQGCSVPKNLTHVNLKFRKNVKSVRGHISNTDRNSQKRLKGWLRSIRDSNLDSEHGLSALSIRKFGSHFRFIGEHPDPPLLNR
jgi:hypothetical protein